MTKDTAMRAEAAFRAEGYDVTARPSRLSHIGWELVGVCSDGKPVYAFSPKDMMLLAGSGQVIRKGKS